MSVERDLDHAERMMERERRAGVDRAQAALADQGGTGVCAECAMAISPLRLKHVPGARCCARCQNELEKMRGR